MELSREMVNVKSSSSSTNWSSTMTRGSCSDEFPGPIVNVPTSTTKSASVVQQQRPVMTPRYHTHPHTQTQYMFLSTLHCTANNTLPLSAVPGEIATETAASTGLGSGTDTVIMWVSPSVSLRVLPGTLT